MTLKAEILDTKGALAAAQRDADVALPAESKGKYSA